MIRASVMVGVPIESGLKRAGMLAIQKYGLSVRDILTLWNGSLVEVVKLHWEFQKENYYETRPVIATPNGKFADGLPPNVGTGTIATSGTSVIGTLTFFTTDVTVGDAFWAGGQLTTVTNIADNTHLTVSPFFNPDLLPGTTYRYGALPHYDSTLERLFVRVSPDGSNRDIGKVITFFSNDLISSLPPPFFAGVIQNYIDVAAPGLPIYEISLFFPSADILSVINVTVGDWLPTGDVIRLLQGNEIISPENILVYDVTNKTYIELTSYKEFDYRRSINRYMNNSSRWCRFKGTTIEFAEGALAPPIGTVIVSAYWNPKLSTALDSATFCADKLVPEVEERFVAKLLSLKMKQPLPTLQSEQTELTQVQVETPSTQMETAKSR